ncbi:MAG: hypothetical protein AAF732_00470 [Pseudomonadota bacterium]
MRSWLLSFIAAVVATFSMVSGAKDAHAACVVGVADWDVLWIRRGPSSRTRKVGAIPPFTCGVVVYWDACRGSWCPVYFRGVNGWSHTRYLQ